jgi:penicillin-binding protein 1A
MRVHRRRILVVRLLLITSSVTAICIGCLTGLFLAETQNIQRQLNIGEYSPALPSLILDRRGKLISQYFAEEKREIVDLDELPPYLIYALIAKEDRTFYGHIGFSLKGFLRAAWNIITGNYFSGGSTISQQVAGNLYENREIETIGRKINELFWSVQLEKRRTKDEILEIYFNFSSFGHGTYGVEAAAQFYFGHSARDVTLAEAAMLVTQLARINSMIRNPNRARIVQKATLSAMVEMSTVSAAEADQSFAEFWEAYDPTRSNLTTAFTERYDEAPYFSELVRRRFETTFYGSSDLYRDGYTIHTTLDLSHQRMAETAIKDARDQLNAAHRDAENRALSFARSHVLPITDVMSLLFSVDELDMDHEEKQQEAEQQLDARFVDVLNAISLLHSDTGLRGAVETYRRNKEEEQRREQIEGVLVTLDNDTGYILAMVGGSDSVSPGLNLAVDSSVPPGSAIKPLYYWSAIEGGQITPATLLFDSSSVFLSDISAPYVPENFLGSWSGPVLARTALARSVNVPAVKVLDAIGLETGIESIALLLGEPDRSGDRLRYPRDYSIGLGVVGVAPLSLARAYAVFPRLGRGVEPFAIRYIEDRNGNVIYDNERRVLEELSKQRVLMSSQTAYLMTDMLASTIASGTLARRVAEAGGLDGTPMAGKTGTTDGWSDAWTVGYSPYVTTAVWFGFVTPGNSLGLYQTGALAAGPVWVKYMKQIHEDLPSREFAVPETGIIGRQVCAVSGSLPTEMCTDGVLEEIFVIGTEPKELCTYHAAKNGVDALLIRRMRDRLQMSDGVPGFKSLTLPAAVLPEVIDEIPR